MMEKVSASAQNSLAASPAAYEEHRKLAARHRAAAIAFYHSARLKLAAANRLASLPPPVQSAGPHAVPQTAATQSTTLSRPVEFGQSRAGNLTVLGGDQAEVKALL